ncbi:MAG: adenine specific methyltransferase [Caulobacteraceae bacterium]|nr:adenine specific methyltransferase [Caulobacteraceae bacterium]
MKPAPAWKAATNALAPVSEALGEALGIRFEGEKGAHFFRSTLIQTLFYGVFSAWVLWNEGNPKPGDKFRWRESAYHLGLPVLRTLFHQLADPQKLRDLGLEEVLDWTEATLARVERAAFFARFALGEAVQYFYEPFLAEFDPELRKQFGVWYTPPEIVRYMVGRVDRALVENYGIPDGLADPRVVVLDPCCGTGAYLVETLRVVYARLNENMGANQAALSVKEAAMTRLFGFELLPAPYVIAHLQIDLQLARLGAPMSHEPEKAKKGEKQQEAERAGVFLTNALTGWVPPVEPKTLLFPELAAERDAADKVKRDAKILVIIGNPPYDGFAGISVDEERGLSHAYRTTKAAPKPQGQGLNDLYIRFFRMAERRIVEGAPEQDTINLQPAVPGRHGIVCYISNYSWLDGLSHPGMRERFLEVFHHITIDCLNGDKYKTGKKSPDGTPDPSVFSAEHNREGIQVGTAVALLERWPAKHSAKQAQSEGAEVQFKNWWGKEKRAELVASLAELTGYEQLHPANPLGLPFVPVAVRLDYKNWALLTDLLAESFPGVTSGRDEALVDFDLERLDARMRRYFDPKLGDEDVREFAPRLMEETQRFNPKAVRAYLVKRGYLKENLVRFCYRPFDVRWLYWEPETKLLDEKRRDYFANVFKGNIFIEARQRQVKDDWNRGYVTSCIADSFGNGRSSFFPLLLANDSSPELGPSARVRETPDMFSEQAGGGNGEPVPNLTLFAFKHLAKLSASPEDLFFHIVAILHSATYRTENAGALRQDWPRVPLPASGDTLREGAALGRQVATLLDPETDAPGVTSGSIRPHLKGLAELTVTGTVKPKTADLSLTARWGYAGQGGVVMPGPGLVRNGTRGDGFLDIHLNATTCWRDVPAEVWAYTLGGYQVLKKWLSYREAVLLHRPLTATEALDFTKHVRRIAALLALHAHLDAHYRASTVALKKG